MAMRIVLGAALAVLTIVAMPIGSAQSTAPAQVQPPYAPPPEPGVQPCYVNGVKCIDLFKHQVEPCDVERHPCDVKPHPMPAQPGRRQDKQ